jgi:hypothetical protein
MSLPGTFETSTDVPTAAAFGAKGTSAGDRRTTPIYEYTSKNSGSAQPGTSTASARPVTKIAFPDAVPVPRCPKIRIGELIDIDRKAGKLAKAGRKRKLGPRRTQLAPVPPRSSGPSEARSPDPKSTTGTMDSGPAAARRPGMAADGATLIRPAGCELDTPRHSGLKFMATPLMQ